MTQFLVKDQCVEIVSKANNQLNKPHLIEKNNKKI